MHSLDQSAVCAWFCIAAGYGAADHDPCSAVPITNHPCASADGGSSSADDCRAAVELNTATNGISGRGAAPQQSQPGGAGRLADDLVFDFDGGEAAPQTPRLAGVVPQARLCGLFLSTAVLQRRRQGLSAACSETEVNSWRARSHRQGRHLMSLAVQGLPRNAHPVAAPLVAPSLAAGRQCFGMQCIVSAAVTGMCSCRELPALSQSAGLRVGLSHFLQIYIFPKYFHFH